MMKKTPEVQRQAEAIADIVVAQVREEVQRYQQYTDAAIEALVGHVRQEHRAKRNCPTCGQRLPKTS